jgi:origin recognition complex subunit 2
MKRKKQPKELSDGLGDEPTEKRARSGNSDEEEEGRHQPRQIPIKRRSSRRRERDDGNTHTTADPAQCIMDDKVGGDTGRLEEPTDKERDGMNDEDAPIVMNALNGRASNTLNGEDVNGMTPAKPLNGRKLFLTPVKNNGSTEMSETPRLERHADRSARRKTTRNLIERTVLGNTSDNDEEDEEMAQHIYGSEEGEELEQDIEVDEEASASAPATPAKRGRPKGSKNRQRSPTPVHDMPPHEVYFSQNRGGHSKTSNNNLSSVALLDHEEYFTLVRDYKDPHTAGIDSLQKLHASSFNQWRFELSQDFNICLYGWGSKRSLLLAFAEYIYQTQEDHTRNKIVVVNGYVHNLTIRDVLNTIAGAISERGERLGSQPAEMLEKLIVALERERTNKITVVIHSVDGPALRRPKIQTIISRLSSHPQIQLIASADHPSFPLLWDSSLRSTFNFLFHNCTTFQPYTSEVDVVEVVHELLGRSGRRIGGKEGVNFVLKSLPENAKNLFRVLIGEQLAAMDENLRSGFGGSENDDDDDNEHYTSNLGRNDPGVEYKVLYQKACEEFICSSEMSFRTLLKE